MICWVSLIHCIFLSFLHMMALQSPAQAKKIFFGVYIMIVADVPESVISKVCNSSLALSLIFSKRPLSCISFKVF